MKKITIFSTLFVIATTTFSSLLHAAPAVEPIQHDIAGGAHLHRENSGKSWTDFPLLMLSKRDDGRERNAVRLVPTNLKAKLIDAYSNDLKDKNGHRLLPLELAGARLDKHDAGGFHWLTAREEQPGKILVASTVYYFSDRGSKNPTAMFMQQKNELEIIPQPLPREHSRYRANEDWKFLVRFNGQPLANQPIKLQTSNGSKVQLLSDAQGVLSLHVPDDFKREDATTGGTHRHGRPGADFVLATTHNEAGISYLTGFSSSYGPDAFDQRSLVWGLGFTFLGMMGAAPLLRQRKTSSYPATAASKKLTEEA